MQPSRPRRSALRARLAPTPSVPVSESQQLLLPLIVAFVLALLLAWPTAVRAQEATTTASSAGTHTVRAGETLWSLAARYYGDGHKWRDLLSLNGLGEGGERGLAVGQVLRVPTQTPPLAQARAAMADAPPARTPSAAVTPAEPETVKPAEPEAVKPAETASVTVEPSAAASSAPPAAPTSLALGMERVAAAPLVPEATDRAVRIGLVRPAQLAAARGRDNNTVFIGPAPFDADTMAGTIWLRGDESFVKPASRRDGEFHAAPVALAADGWKATGRVLARAQASGASEARAQQQRMQQRDLVEVALPEGVSLEVGARVVSVSQGADLGRGARLALPTGILTIEGERNGVALARVTRLYGLIEQGQALLPYTEAPTPTPAASVDTVETRVRWITDAPLLPSLQAYLVLEPVAGVSLETGDRFELLSSGASSTRVAVVRVVRVTPDGATAIVMQQEQPAIKVGMRARRIGHAP